MKPRFTVYFNEDLQKYVARYDPNGPCEGRVAAAKETNRLNKQAGTHQPQASQRHEPMDIESGLGIGGYGSDDYSIHAEYRPERVIPGNGHKFGYRGVRYDEACECCGHETTVCNVCGCCSKHCNC